MEFKAAYHTDVGIRKSTNQDSVAIRIIDTPKGKVAFSIVCDGMGGLAKGELASKEVILAFCDWFDNRFTDEILDGSFSGNLLHKEWGEIIQVQNQKLGAFGTENHFMLGTTISVLLMFEEEFYIVHVGDSRIYEVTDQCKMLTKDQTFVAREVEMGRMTPEQAEVDPRRSVLLQCVGASEVVTPDFMKGKTKKNATYLLCSDGFRHKISDEEVIEKLGPEQCQDEDQLRYGCFYLTELVKNRRETDNISVITIRTM